MFEDPVSADPQVLIAARARQKRDSILANTVDRVNPVRYQTLTAEQQQELAAYRQALLDVPSQPGFPDTIIWPANPPWLP